MKHTFDNIRTAVRRGQKKIIFLCAAICCTLITQAQVFNSQTSDNSDEVVKSEIVDGNDIVHVGYDGINNSPLHNGIIFRSSITGAVIWYTSVSVPGAAAGSETVLNKVIKGQNGHYYAVGWCRPGNGIGAGILQTIICEFDDNTGLLLNWEVRNNGSAMLLMDLCQLDNGFIAAVGQYNAPQQKALVMIYDPALVFTAIRTFAFPPPARPIFTAVTHNGNMIIAGGNLPVGTPSDGILTYLDATTPAAPAYFFTFNYPIATTKIGLGTPMNLTRVNKLFYDQNSNHVIANVSISSGGVEDGVILEIDNNTHAVTNALQYGDPANPMSNSVRDGLSIISFTPGNGDYIVGLSPGNTVFNSGSMPLPVPPSSTVLTRITANAVAVNRINLPGQTHFTTFTSNNKLYSSGYTTNAPLSAAIDIFDQSSDYNMTTTGVPSCVVDYPITVMPLQVPVQAPNWNPTPDPSTPGNDPTDVSVVPVNQAVCGTPPDTGTGGDSCSLQCYWRVTGNTITMPNNIFGTLTNDDIRIFTNNTHTSTIAANGWVGINQTVPTTKLHAMGTAPASIPLLSGIRFENLPQGSGNALVVDGAGYVYQAQSILFRPEDVKDLQNQLSELQQQINNFNNMISGNSNAADGGNTINVSPNPNDGRATVNYSINGTFSKASIRIVDNAGRMIQEIPVSAGSGSIKVTFPAGTASGQFMCTLMVDNKIAATQKVVLLNK